MRGLTPIAAIAICAALAAPAQARRSRSKGKEQAAASVKVNVIAQGVLRAQASEIGKPLTKVKPRDRLTFVEFSPDRKWAQVRKGRVAGWILAEELIGLPDALPSPPPTPPDPGPGDAPTPAPAPTPISPRPGPGPGPGTTKPPAPAPTPVRPAPAPVRPAPAPEARPKDPPADPVAAAPAPQPQAAPAPAPGRSPWLPLSGPWISVGGGVGLLSSAFDSTFKSGLDPELYRYSLDFLPAVGAQARLGYTFGHKWLRVGVDAGYRFGGGGTIVIKLKDKDGLPSQPGGTGAMLPAQRQNIPVTAHDADGALSFGGYLGLGNKLEMSLRLRAGLQFQAFLPDFNASAVLPKEIAFGPLIGGVVELQTRSVPGFGVRLDGAYIPYAEHQQNPGAHDSLCPANSPAECRSRPEQTTGFNLGGSVSFRVVRDFEVELGYRLLSMRTVYAEGGQPERLAFDRDPVVRARAPGEVLLSAERTTLQQTIFLGVAFRR